MAEHSLSFESASVSLPKAKRQRKEIPFDSLCKGKKPNGDQCSFSCIKDSLFCKRHTPKVEVKSIETNTCNGNMIDSSTNTEGTILDITTANKVILEFLDDRAEHEREMSELIELYNNLRYQIEQLQLI